MSKSNRERMFELQEEQGWSDESLGELAIAFTFDPDEAGMATEFVNFLERYAAEN